MSTQGGQPKPKAGGRWRAWRVRRKYIEVPPLNMDDTLPDSDGVGEALERIRVYCVPAAKQLQQSGDKWKIRARYLGLPATTLAAASGVTGLGTEGGRVVAAALALASAALGAVVASLAPAQRSEERYTQARQMTALARNIGILLFVDRDQFDTQGLRAALEDAMGQLDAIERRSPAPSFMYRLRRGGGLGTASSP